MLGTRLYSSLQAGILARQAAAVTIKSMHVPNADITILSDSQEATRAIRAETSNSKIVHKRRTRLNELVFRHTVHINNPGKYRANELARLGATIRLLSEFVTVIIPLGTWPYYFRPRVFRHIVYIGVFKE